ncbi:MAG: prepilin-type N-terminal cleavage/methylation domain-containing protein [Gammaproteobacteria bacterium]|nr:prepilin-type N-terminal cleavage/methylation domain-containing protein [Gammaproteobacteria bacterium]
MADKRLIASRFQGARLAGSSGANNSRGFSLFELVVVVVLIALLMVIAIARFLALQADAERVAMETIAGTLRSALGMKVAESIVADQLSGLAVLEGSNPMERLAETPTNYLGALPKPDPAQLEKGNWYFDQTNGELVYLVRNKAQFSGGAANPPRARFAVRLVYTDRNGNGRFDKGVDAVEGLRLAPIEPYQWMH